MGLYWIRGDVNTVGNPFSGSDGWMLDYEYVKIFIRVATGEVKFNYQINGNWKGWKAINVT